MYGAHLPFWDRISNFAFGLTYLQINSGPLAWELFTCLPMSAARAAGWAFADKAIKSPAQIASVFNRISRVTSRAGIVLKGVNSHCYGCLSSVVKSRGLRHYFERRKLGRALCQAPASNRLRKRNRPDAHERNRARRAELHRPRIGKVDQPAGLPST
jgi:hypothetical protein